MTHPDRTLRPLDWVIAVAVLAVCVLILWVAMIGGLV